MKKTIIMSCLILAIFSFIAFNYNNKYGSATDTLEIASVEVLSEAEEVKKENFPDFIYDVGPRYRAIKKSDINNEASINTFFTESQIEKMNIIKSVEVVVLENNKLSDKRKVGTNNLFSNTHSVFTDAQINFMRSFDFSTHFLIRVDYKQKNKETGNLEDNYSRPHYTLVPEIQAEYIYGKKALVKYLIENTKAVTAHISEDKLKPAKLFFTVTKEGTIGHVRLDCSSGYSDIDELVTQLMTSTPGGWIPAINSDGEKVNQELVISFGLMGC